MIGDAATPLVKYSSVFSAMDVCYDAAPENIGNYGLLAASCRAIEGTTCGSGEGMHRTCRKDSGLFLIYCSMIFHD